MKDSLRTFAAVFFTTMAGIFFAGGLVVLKPKKLIPANIEKG